MILAHIIIGAMPVENKFSWFWFLGSIIPDVDHLFIILKNKIFSYDKLIDSIANEEKYGIIFSEQFARA